jgi:inorganic triphosphatase YgiF
MEQMHDPPFETELKLLIPPGARAALEAHPALRDAEVSADLHQLSTYYDTAELDLARAGISLRVRRSGTRLVQTVKSATDGSGAALHRGEWEWPVTRERPDADLLSQTGLRDLPADLAARLRPVCTAEIHRTTRLLHLPDGTVVEAALDQGTILAGAAREPLAELELELKHGDTGPLLRLAVALQQAGDLPLSLESKSERGARLAGLHHAASKATDPELAGDHRARAAFRAVLGNGLGHLLANAPAAQAGDAEGIHQARIAIRRLRTALALFGPLLEPQAAARFTDSLRGVGQVLGTARDAEVFRRQVRQAPESEAPGGEEWRHPLDAPASAALARAQAAVREMLGGAGFASLVLGLAAWAEEGALLSGQDRRIAVLAPDLLDRLQHTVDKRGRHLARLAPAELHALRKSVKKLRYAVEFLSGLYGAKPVDRFLRRCKALQDLLGEINDAAMAGSQAAALAGDQASLSVAVGALERAVAGRREEALARLPAAWAGFSERGPFWQ